MKKLFFAVALLCSATLFTACNDGKPHCWEITSTVTINGASANSTTHYWGTEDEVNSYIENAKKANEAQNIANFTISKKRTSASESDCKDSLF